MCTHFLDTKDFVHQNAIRHDDLQSLCFNRWAMSCSMPLLLYNIKRYSYIAVSPEGAISYRCNKSYRVCSENGEQRRVIGNLSLSFRFRSLIIEVSVLFWFLIKILSISFLQFSYHLFC